MAEFKKARIDIETKLRIFFFSIPLQLSYFFNGTNESIRIRKALLSVFNCRFLIVEAR